MSPTSVTPSERPSRLRELTFPSQPTPPARGALSIQGFVVHRDGRPAAGFEVSASWSVPGESVSSIPREPEDPSTPLSALEVRGAALMTLCEVVAAGHGDAPVVARTTTHEDGTFTLDGLPEGSVALWAQGAGHAGIRFSVKAGATQVRLMVGSDCALRGNVIDEAKRPVRGARVTVFHPRNSRFFEAVSDDQGRFSVGPLAGETYRVVVHKPGLLPRGGYLTPSVSELRDVVLHTPRRIVGRVVTREQEPVPDIHVLDNETGHIAWTDTQGRFVLEDSPTGPTFLSTWDDGRRRDEYIQVDETLQEVEVRLVLEDLLLVPGRVVDTRGRPVPNAEVSVRSDSVVLLRSAQATTDAEGRFLLRALPMGACTFDVKARGFHALENEVGELSTNEPLEFVLEPAVLVEGTLVDPEGRPVPGVFVRLTPAIPGASEGTGAPDDTYAPAFERPGSDQTHSDAQGRFLFERSEPGRVHLRTESNDHLTARQVVDAPASDVRLVLRPGGRVEGHVVDAKGWSLGPVQLSVRASPEAPLTEPPVLSNDIHGGFALGGLPPGRHVLVAIFNKGASHRAVLPIEILGTETVTVVVTMDTGLSVSGIVVDESGHPIRDASVRALSELASQARQDGSGEPISTSDASTDEEGRFTVAHLLPGPCRIRATALGHTMFEDPSPASGAEEEEPFVTVPAGSTDTRLVMRYDGGVRGRLVREDGTPLTRFDIDDSDESRDDGTFVVHRKDADARWLTFSAPGFCRTQYAVEFERGRLRDLGNIIMKAAGMLNGRLLFAGSLEPIAGAVIEAHQRQTNLADLSIESANRLSIDPPSVGNTDTRADGTFTLIDVDPANVTLTVQYLFFPPQVHAVDGSDTPVEIHWAPDTEPSADC
ncbi:carboxypeptidase-like regulatory domain-containing protein [Myxococcus stipitatus]|uniref:carboxypeptidase regulatory-like domain-containing protein n=1 Tax=Myxococcus stipitatus TaxID=83455 RepID=UPI001F4850FC|nr:carboxypeptidase regulatory-like domain-containing protein [Myxococcus stipitatus]MCE9668597.1 carboxypeptidase-like regulatory domain-containing protein [Myxococcus stipitatus]